MRKRPRAYGGARVGTAPLAPSLAPLCSLEQRPHPSRHSLGQQAALKVPPAGWLGNTFNTFTSPCRAGAGRGLGQSQGKSPQKPVGPDKGHSLREPALVAGRCVQGPKVCCTMVLPSLRKVTVAPSRLDFHLALCKGSLTGQEHPPPWGRKQGMWNCVEEAAVRSGCLRPSPRTPSSAWVVGSVGRWPQPQDSCVSRGCRGLP